MKKLIATGKMSRAHYQWLALVVCPMLTTPTEIEFIGDCLVQSNERFDREKFVSVAIQAWEDANIRRYEDDL